ncbi:sulfatase-like hydrolase/transferase [Dasania marina]|uniref:sulfatase-like hydrolase/transferase n=1 Tax=Dasania marina TaxID=471499 RepID=UPI0030D93539|tara:strand:+ start:29823 stop:31781 length:1959 start_codon:yes stop_codon:yes gene_type:complete
MAYVKRSLVLTWLIAVIAIFSYALPSVNDIEGGAYLVVVALLQAFILVLPLYILSIIFKKYKSNFIWVVTHIIAIGSILILLSNLKLHSMYNFFIDGFVINLLSTPGGIDALGLSRSFYYSATIATLVIIVIYVVIIKLVAFEKVLNNLSNKRIGLFFIGSLFIIESCMFALASYQSNPKILTISSRIVWHIPVTARHTLQRLGVEKPKTVNVDNINKASGAFNYPISQLDNKGVIKSPYNIIWLTAESLRHDMLTSEVMPNTYKFAMKNSWFKSHYSGGNGTRLGMFSQFYGLYGSYWFDVLYQRKSPLLLDTLIENNYDLMAYTSARFTYPEFDKTIFTKFKASQLQEHFSPGFGWQRDKKNTKDLINYISSESRTKKPFFAFMFFESAHANYYFPSDNVIEKDYLEDFDYLSVNIEKNITKIKNRYINSSHYLDTRLGLIFEALKKNDLYDNTIVIVTGDHGEEFMEKGRWGHNSTFVQEQIRVPLVIHMPNKTPAINENMTSHLDMPATVLSALGFTQDSSIYSFGKDLFSNDYDRKYTVASDWHGNALITHNAKFILSLKASRNSMKYSTLNDAVINDSDIESIDKTKLTDFVKELARFYSGSAESKRIVNKIELHKKINNEKLIVENSKDIKESNNNGLSAGKTLN